MVATGSYGLMGYTFVDFGDKFAPADADGLESPGPKLAVSISNASPGVVQLNGASYGDGDRHGLVDGDFVRFQNVAGMVELNDGVPREVTVIDPFTFSIEDTSGYGKCVHGGYFVKVKQHMPTEFTFKPFGESVKEPQLLVDWKHRARPKNLHKLLMVSARGAICSAVARCCCCCG